MHNIQLSWFRKNSYKVKLPNLYSEIFEISTNCSGSSNSLDNYDIDDDLNFINNDISF